MSEARLYLVAYDIANPKRWRRVQKLIKGFCQRSQLSVFICRASKARIARFEREMRKVLHQGDDRLMILDLGIANSATPPLTATNPLSDITQLGAVVL